MPAGTTPIFVATPQGTPVNFATANTARDGTGTIATLYTAGANGARVDSIMMCAAGTTTAGVLRIFQKTSAGTFRLLKEILVTAVTPSTTVEAWNYIWREPFIMPANDVLGISTNNAETFNSKVNGGDY